MSLRGDPRAEVRRQPAASPPVIFSMGPLDCPRLLTAAFPWPETVTGDYWRWSSYANHVGESCLFDSWPIGIERPKTFSAACLYQHKTMRRRARHMDRPGGYGSQLTAVETHANDCRKGESMPLAWSNISDTRLKQAILKSHAGGTDSF